ncbi:MAG: hypothetical protein ABSE72_07215 [Bacteroidales bacterium]|jgi:hypothetical protein
MPKKEKRTWTRYRSAITGQFITKEEADKEKSTTVGESVLKKGN